MYEISKAIDELPSQSRKELYEYAEFLLKKFNKSNKTKSFKLDWVDDLKELSIEYNSVELQHSISDMWNS